MEKLFYAMWEEMTFDQIVKKYKLNRKEAGRVKQIKVGYCAYLGKPELPVVHRIR
jgi:hypothetical protein